MDGKGIKTERKVKIIKDRNEITIRFNQTFLLFRAMREQIETRVVYAQSPKSPSI